MPIGSDELVNLDELRATVRPDADLISDMSVNNEIGVIQPMDEIGQICKEFKIPFTQMLLKPWGRFQLMWRNGMLV